MTAGNENNCWMNLTLIQVSSLGNCMLADIAPNSVALPDNDRVCSAFRTAIQLVRREYLTPVAVGAELHTLISKASPSIRAPD